MRIKLSLFILALLSFRVEAQDLLTTYDQALQRNPNIRQAEAIRNAALENKPQSVAALLPNVSVISNLNHSWVLTKTGDRIQQNIAGGTQVDFWNSAATLNLTQPIYHHELWVQLSQADNTVAAAEANYEAAQQSLIYDTAYAYFQILYSQDSLEFIRMQRQSIERQLDQAKARFEVGLIAITDVDAAQAAFDQARADEIKAENEYENAKEAMRQVIGDFDGKVTGLLDDIPLPPPEPQNMDAWNEKAQDSNLLIIAAQNQAELSKKGIELQFAGHYPTLDLVGNAGFTDNNRPNGIRTETQSIGMVVKVPLFQGGLVNSKVRQAREQFQSAQEYLDVQRRATTKDVKTAYRGIMTSISQVAALKSALVSSKSALDATEASFEVGTRTMIDVLLVQSKMYQAKQAYAKARYDYITNSLLLKQATGVLMREDVESVNRWLRKS